MGVMTLKPEATSMLSLFWVLVCVVAQLINIAAHIAAMPQRKICVIGFIGRNIVVDNKFLTDASESDPGRDLRAMHDGVEKEAVVLVVNGECPVTDLSKDVTGEVDTDYPFDLPH